MCSFCKSRRDDGVWVKCQNTTTGREKGCYSKLSKPPSKPPIVKSRKLQTKRLQKRIPDPSDQSPISSIVYILRFEAYPYNTTPEVILGVFSSINTVTAGAISHGAYAFSREGLHDGREYLSPTGRIRIFTEELHQPLIKASTSRPANYIPHPDRRIEAEREAETKTFYLALRQSPSKTSYIGLFKEKTKAWVACVNDQASVVLTERLLEDTRWSDEKGMPYIQSRIVGGGSHLWSIGAFEIDQVVR